MPIKKIAFFLLFLFIALLFYVWQRTQNIRLGYEVSNLQAENDRLMQENLNLQLKISSYMSMEKLDSVAKKKGLITPEEKDIIYLEGK